MGNTEKTFIMFPFILFITFCDFIYGQDSLFLSTQYSFRIKFPSSWEIKKGDGEHVIVKALKEGSSIMVNVGDLLT